MIELSNLRPYQLRAIETGIAFFNDPMARRKLLTMPTGTGKSVCQLYIQANVQNSWIVTPRVEIVHGMLQELGVDCALQKAHEIGFLNRITTPLRLVNKLKAGESIDIDALILDEVHHHNAETYQMLDILTNVPTLGFTATPFRGTPQGTKQLRETWGPPEVVLSYPDAVSQGYLSMPECEIVPLVDDDEIKIQNGVFVVESIEDATKTRLEDLVDLVGKYYQGYYDRPTMLSLSSSELVHLALMFGNEKGIPMIPVLEATSLRDRQNAFAACLAGTHCLVHINVVSEGVNLPTLKRWIDGSPILSGVKWLQMFGRITRPVQNGPSGQYICTNRNLFRHAYLLAGCLPPEFIASAQTAFPPSVRSFARRAVGLENLGRFTCDAFRTLSGVQCGLYCISAVDGMQTVQYAAIIHPNEAEVFWVRKFDWGRWERCEPPNDVTGFRSTKPNTLTEKQKQWFDNQAARFGLDPTQNVTNRTFQILPILNDLRLKLR